MITYDNSTLGNLINSSQISWTHNSTGASILVVFVGIVSGGGILFDNAYYGSTSNKFTHQGYVTINYIDWHLYTLPNPGTQSSVVMFSFNSSLDRVQAFGLAASYSGTAGVPDSFTSNTGISPTTVNTTVTHTGSWVVTGMLSVVSSPSQTTGGGVNNTVRQSGTLYSNQVYEALSDSNGTVGTGSQGAQISGTANPPFNGYVNGGYAVSLMLPQSTAGLFMISD